MEHSYIDQTRFTWNIQRRDAIVPRETMVYMTAHVPRETMVYMTAHVPRETIMSMLLGHVSRETPSGYQAKYLQFR